jgi:tetratricopeptide (TPR) repeat protein
VDRRRGFTLVSWAASLFLLPLLAQPAYAQGDPLELQKLAIQRIDAIVDYFRKTGDARSRLPELAQVEAALIASNRMLAARGDWSALALGLIKQGHVYRMQNQWQAAIPLYQQAQQAAERGQNLARQSEALAWRAMAEYSQRNLGQAAVCAREAVRLAEATGDNDLLAHALEVLGTVQVYQLDLAGAADTFNRDVEVARQAKDPMKLYFAYLGRSDFYKKSGQRCDFQRSFEACKQALERARADLQQALAIVRSRGYSMLVKFAEEGLQDIELAGAMNQSQQRNYEAFETSGVFRPKALKDVLVTEKFSTGTNEIPQPLLDYHANTLRLVKQLGADAGNDARDSFIEGAINEARGNSDAALASYLKAVNTLESDRRALRDSRVTRSFGSGLAGPAPPRSRRPVRSNSWGSTRRTRTTSWSCWTRAPASRRWPRYR